VRSVQALTDKELLRHKGDGTLQERVSVIEEILNRGLHEVNQ